MNKKQSVSVYLAYMHIHVLSNDLDTLHHQLLETLPYHHPAGVLTGKTRTLGYTFTYLAY